MDEGTQTLPVLNVGGVRIEVMNGEFEMTRVTRARELLVYFLTDRKNSTAQAYRSDLRDFARFLDTPPAEATARLLAGGPRAAWHLAVKYGTDLRRRELAPATVARRLNTLRALLRDANQQNLIAWQLRLPTDDDISRGYCQDLWIGRWRSRDGLRSSRSM
jgi:hypothetical protein